MVEFFALRHLSVGPNQSIIRPSGPATMFNLTVYCRRTLNTIPPRSEVSSKPPLKPAAQDVLAPQARASLRSGNEVTA